MMRLATVSLRASDVFNPHFLRLLTARKPTELVLGRDHQVGKSILSPAVLDILSPFLLCCDADSSTASMNYASMF